MISKKKKKMLHIQKEKKERERERQRERVREEGWKELLGSSGKSWETEGQFIPKEPGKDSKKIGAWNWQNLIDDADCESNAFYGNVCK